MIRLHHVRIRKARGFRRAALVLLGRGLWTVECVGCPGVEFPTTQRHDQAVTMAAAHIGTMPGILSTSLALDAETAARIRGAVMAHACRNPPGRQASSRTPVERKAVPAPCENPTRTDP